MEPTRASLEWGTPGDADSPTSEHIRHPALGDLPMSEHTDMGHPAMLKRDGTQWLWEPVRVW